MKQGIVTWGVLGTADIAMSRVIPAMRTSRFASIEALASRSTERAEKAAAQMSVPRAYGSYESLLSDPEIEAVYVPLPNHMHAEWVIAAAKSGKHCLCEKLMATTSSEARQMVKACQDAGVYLMEVFMY